MKKLISRVVATSLVAMMSISAIPQMSISAESQQNYAEALQKSLYFYECQQAGELPEWNRVEWRANSTMDDHVLGGWYDAGDHVKFNLPMGYSASMLAWGLYQYGDGIEKIGQWETYQNNLEFVLDYFVNCDEGDNVVYQVGNGQEDHTWWGPVELLAYGMQEDGSYVRPYYTTDNEGYSAVLGEMAAALASGAVALKGKSDKVDTYIEHAKHYFELADAQKSDSGYNSSDASGFYRSSEFYDDLFYSANWLYMATGDKTYLDKATSYIPNLGKELGTNELKYSWCHCWDDVMQGGLLLYAINTQDNTYINQVKKHLDYWCNDVQTLEGGFKWLTTWGCLRYAETAGFIGAVACDTILSNDNDKSKYVDFYETQINYALGDNPDNRSYVVGYGENYPVNVHHRTAHSSYKNDLEYPETNAHILYGALVGGPTQDGNYEDSRGNYINNEVATDYNAGFTALLCKMVDEYGGNIDTSFPQPEEIAPEFYVEAMIKQNSSSGVSLSLKFTNRSTTPARIEDNMSYRYYFDVSEIIDSGFKPEDIVVRVDRDQASMYDGVTPAQVSPITQYDGNIYYIEVSYPDGRVAMPVSEGRNQCETMLALVFPNYQTGWDATNDYSNQDLLDYTPVGDSTKGVVTDKITVYQNGILIYGTEPDGTTPEDNKPIPTPSKVGDVNQDGNITYLDLLLLKKHILGINNLSNIEVADMNTDNNINVTDVVMLKNSILGE
ncbi:MAG: glycoside hydrolase family 9 protein [Oscillospiraceae bacterium]